jgi:hypothetical protein
MPLLNIVIKAGQEDLVLTIAEARTLYQELKALLDPTSTNPWLPAIPTNPWTSPVFPTPTFTTTDKAGSTQ